jgi:hypothetical protein
LHFAGGWAVRGVRRQWLLLLLLLLAKQRTFVPQLHFSPAKVFFFALVLLNRRQLLRARVRLRMELFGNSPHVTDIIEKSQPNIDENPSENRKQKKELPAPSARRVDVPC